MKKKAVGYFTLLLSFIKAAQTIYDALITKANIDQSYQQFIEKSIACSQNAPGKRIRLILYSQRFDLSSQRRGNDIDWSPSLCDH